MKFKKVLCAALALVSCMSLASCGEKPTEKYIISSDSSFAPFEFLDEEKGVYTGVDMDLVAAIAEDQKFEYEMKNEGFKAAMGSVQSGQSDAMIAGMSISDERKQTFDFSDSYFDDGQILVTTPDSDIKSEADLKGKKVAAKNGTLSLEYTESIKDKYGFEISYYEDSPSMYQAVISGVNDACFEDYSVIAWAIKSEGVKLHTIGDVINPAGYGFAVKKGENAELIEKFNAGLKNIKANGKYKEILSKYGY